MAAATFTPRRLELFRRWGDAIRAARHARGLSQPGAAAALGVHVQTIRSFEQGRRGPSLAIRRRIVAEWGGDPAALMTAEDWCPCCGRPQE